MFFKLQRFLYPHLTNITDTYGIIIFLKCNFWRFFSVLTNVAEHNDKIIVQSNL